MRLIYSGLLYLIAPLVPFYLRKRGRKNPDYLLNWNERFATNLVNPSDKPIIWLHSVSVGETRAMQRLVDIIHNELPKYQILITVMTPTGRATAKKLYPFTIVHYVPYDLPHSVIKFYKTFNPVLGVIMETEIWPNLIYYAAERGMPLYLVNARLSNKSYNGYNRFKWALMPILNRLTGILCQDEGTCSNFLKLGYNGDLKIVGNTKFDLVTNSETDDKIKLFSKLFCNRKIVTFASSRDGEEKLFLEQIEFTDNVLYLIIPRHPERFLVVEQLLIEKKILYQKRSDNEIIAPTTQVVIGDSLGEMLAYYAISHLAVIGGSFNDFGGQNPIEAIYMHKPVIFGPSMYNFADVAKNSLEYGCAKQIDNMLELNSIIQDWLNKPEEYLEYQGNCQRFIDIYQGASQRIFNIAIKSILSQNTLIQTDTN